jgi:hypothetical protein
MIDEPHTLHTIPSVKASEQERQSRKQYIMLAAPLSSEPILNLSSYVAATSFYTFISLTFRLSQ